MKYSCCDDLRLEVIARSGSANAIAFIEVLDALAPPFVARQRTLLVRLLRSGFVLAADNLRISGGERIGNVAIEWAESAAAPVNIEASVLALIDEAALTLVVRTRSDGDFSRYTLALVSAPGSDQPPAGFDPLLSRIEFSFKVECPSDYDCATAKVCPPQSEAQPDIDYLVKDYAGFRRLMLDRMSLLAPDWRERSAADLGVTLVELLAYAADNLSYRQDAIANEAYLATARQRISVRRHARLVDYRLHEGCNARAFVHIAVQGNLALPRGTRLLTRSNGLGPTVDPGSRAEVDARSAGALVFETAHDAALDPGCNELHLYTWGDSGCCLPRGATRATLRGLASGLAVNQFLLFEEVRSPTRFTTADADRDKRHLVRLTRVQRTVDPSGRLFDESPADAPLDITEIEWDASDALPFPLCLSVSARPDLVVSVARGNLVLADHGLAISGESLGEVPADARRYARATSEGDCCDPLPLRVLPLRFNPALKERALTHGFALADLLAAPPTDEDAWWSASALRAIDARDASPRVTALTSVLGTRVEGWTVQRDLLASADDATDFCVEVDDAGRARLRFGNDDHGRRPDAHTSFVASYRVGNGASGNVGAESIAHLAFGPTNAVLAVRNPLPASGGVEPEDIEAARRDAPQAFRTQERAVTAADYAAASERRPEVQRAAATFRWTGSWHTVFVTADRFGGARVDARFENRLRRHLERFRMAGYDLEVDGPRTVALDIALFICVKPDYFRADVLRAVRSELSADMLADGRLAAFHPDNFSFGDNVYASRVIAAAAAVQGVASAELKTFQRLQGPSTTSLAEGVIRIGRLEIAQLANNPNFRERGRLVVTAGGGK